MLLLREIFLCTYHTVCILCIPVIKSCLFVMNDLAAVAYVINGGQAWPRIFRYVLLFAAHMNAFACRFENVSAQPCNV